MVFDSNAVIVHHPTSGFTLSFLGVDALKACVAPGDEPAQVAAAAVVTPP